ncbi:ATP-binding cassette subfamily C protein CydD [Humitalea rosea]|uniref:ATP-binding cassette subfamily C protein CydD n=1 Tax=Humitalea rosea TaxID=990373 RepID=A0A2W7IT16_9PROT|nr:thiol reductant ABC exporter subunit CydD [Humitalea rosea]PZW50941.1 ATP-binding cassette subfamily C protein CydD [Humitalea rosea]
MNQALTERPAKPARRRRSGANAARGLLAATARGQRRTLSLAVALGTCGILVALAQALLTARLLAALLGHGAAEWGDLAAIAALVLVQAGLAIAQDRMQTAAGAAARAGLRGRAMAALFAAGPADSRQIGEKASLVIDRIEALDGHFARWLPAAALAILGPLLAVALATWADPLSGLILAVAVLLVPVAMAFTGIGAAVASRRQFAALEALSGRFLDRMRGLPAIVLFRREAAEAGAMAEAADDLRRRTMKVLRVAFLSATALEALFAAALACMAFRHAALLTGGHPDPVAAILCLLLVPVAFAPLRAFSAAYHERSAAEGAATALAPLLATPETHGLLLEEIPPSVVVTFDRVGLRHDPGLPPALEDISFRVLPGESLVLVGPSGAGKSSILRLLMGFSAPSSGRIALNGREAAALRPAEVRRLSAWVGQRAHLFRATIAENIALARPGATRAAVEAAARDARVIDFAKGLPRGLDTMVGEGGFGLSGGQAQRVAIARAFLRDAPLLLLDEPTAHLDPGTEAEVLDSLRRLAAGRTTVMATHSPAVAARFGRVMRLEEGRFVEQAKWA